MLDVIVAGGMGAVVNYALFTHWFSSGIMVFLETLLKESGIVIQMGAAINAFFSVLFCLFGGTLFMIVWHFLKARMIRFLLSTNLWFLTPKHPLSKVRPVVINVLCFSFLVLFLLLCTCTLIHVFVVDTVRYIKCMCHIL